MSGTRDSWKSARAPEAVADWCIELRGSIEVDTGLVLHQGFFEVCNGIRGSQIQVLVTRGSPERSKLVLIVRHWRSWKSVTVSETVADQCMN